MNENDEMDRIVMDLLHKGFLEIFVQEDGSFLFNVNLQGQKYVETLKRIQDEEQKEFGQGEE